MKSVVTIIIHRESQGGLHESTEMDGVLHSLVSWMVSLLMAGSWNEVSFRAPSNPVPFWGSLVMAG